MKTNGIYSIDELTQIVGWSEQYATSSADRILLGANDIPQKYREAVAEQLKIKPYLAHKLPHWAKLGVYIPQSINLEQATSELCARYKERYISPEDTLIDMTGGLGVDFAALASVAECAIYVEEDIQTYRAAQYNLPLLLPHTLDYKLLCGCSLDLLPQMLRDYNPSIIYIDPARREGGLRGKRVYAIEDCTPNLYDVSVVLEKGLSSPRLMAKLSPMLDIKHTLAHLSGVSSIDIISVKSEVKELLLHIEGGLQIPIEVVPLRCIDLHPSRGEILWSGTLGEEERSDCLLATMPGKYLYEPNGAVMKSGLYKLLGNRFSIEKLSQHTHLYTSARLVEGFPGKVYEVLEQIPFRSSVIKRLHKALPKAMIATRNFPLSTEALRHKLSIADGGDTTLWGVSIGSGTPLLLRCLLLSSS